MTIKRMVTTSAVFLALITMISAGTATAAPRLPPCQTDPSGSAVVHEFSEGSWGYFYRLVWCVENAQIIWVMPEVVPVLPDGSDCTWMGTKAESLKPLPNSDSWLGFNMGWFSCPITADDYPWGIIHVDSDGTSFIQDQGTA